jgi:Cation transport ATPase
MEVTKENKDTVFSKILQLVNQNQDNQTKAASIIQKFEPKYVNSFNRNTISNGTYSISI